MATRRTGSSNPLAPVVGANIRAARGDLTQAQLGERAGVDSQLISKYERGFYMPSTEKLSAIAGALGRELSWFFIDHEKAAA